MFSVRAAFSEGDPPAQLGGRGILPADCDPLTGLKADKTLLARAARAASEQGWQTVAVYTDGTAIGQLNKILKEYKDDAGRLHRSVDFFIAWALNQYQIALEEIVANPRAAPAVFIGARQPHDDSAAWLIAGPELSPDVLNDIQTALQSVDARIRSAWSQPGLEQFGSIYHPKHRMAVEVGFPICAAYLDPAEGPLEWAAILGGLEEGVRTRKSADARPAALAVYPENVICDGIDQVFVDGLRRVHSVPSSIPQYRGDQALDFDLSAVLDRAARPLQENVATRTLCFDVLNLGVLNSALTEPYVDQQILEVVDDILRRDPRCRVERIGGGRYMVHTDLNGTEREALIRQAQSAFLAAMEKTTIERRVGEQPVGLVVTDVVMRGLSNPQDTIPHHDIQKELFRLFGISHIDPVTQEIITLEGQETGIFLEDQESVFSAMARHGRVTPATLDALLDQKIGSQLAMLGVMNQKSAQALLSIQYTIDSLLAEPYTYSEKDILRLMSQFEDKPDEFLDTIYAQFPDIVHECTALSTRVSMVPRSDERLRFGGLANHFFSDIWQRFGDPCLRLQMLTRSMKALDESAHQTLLPGVTPLKRDDHIRRRPICTDPAQGNNLITLVQHHAEGMRLGIYPNDAQTRALIQNVLREEWQTMAELLRGTWPIMAGLLSRNAYHHSARPVDRAALVDRLNQQGIVTPPTVHISSADPKAQPEAA